MERKNLKEFLCDRSNSYIIRWHNRPTVWKENLAEHQFYVARIAFWLAYLALPGYQESCSLGGLFHDEIETMLGDIPSPVKHKFMSRESVKSLENNAIVELQKLVPIVFEDVIPVVTRLHDTSNLVVNQIIHYADTLAALAYIEDQIIGGMKSFTIIEVRDAILEDMKRFDWPWLVLLRSAYPELP